MVWVFIYSINSLAIKHYWERKTHYSWSHQLSTSIFDIIWCVVVWSNFMSIIDNKKMLHAFHYYSFTKYSVIKNCSIWETLSALINIQSSIWSFRTFHALICWNKIRCCQLLQYKNKGFNILVQIQPVENVLCSFQHFVHIVHFVWVTFQC